jgi:plasmid stabilization system protein ParE
LINFVPVPEGGRPHDPGHPPIGFFLGRHAKTSYLIFYRFDKDTLMPERVLHGARDLPRRLLQSPFEDG